MKYGNKITEVDQIKFRSKLEAKRYGQLRLLERVGDVRELTLQPRYKLTTHLDYHICTYASDFRYFDVLRGFTVVEDPKGVLEAWQWVHIKLAQVLYPQENFELWPPAKWQKQNSILRGLRGKYNITSIQD